MEGLARVMSQNSVTDGKKLRKRNPRKRRKRRKFRFGSPGVRISGELGPAGPNWPGAIVISVRGCAIPCILDGEATSFPRDETDGLLSVGRYANELQKSKLVFFRKKKVKKRKSQKGCVFPDVFRFRSGNGVGRGGGSKVFGNCATITGLLLTSDL